MNKTLVYTAMFIMVIFIPQTLFSSGTEETVSIRGFKIMIGEERYSWADGENIPSNPKDLISLETVFSYTYLKPGMKINLDELEAEIRKMEQRLLSSGLFFTAQVYVVPPKQYPDSRTVMIKLAPGSVDRFGGGLIYAYWKRLALNGGRVDLLLCAGYNQAGIGYGDYNLFGKNLIFSANAGYANPGLGQAYPAFYHEFRADLFFGFRPHPDIEIGVGGEFNSVNHTEISPEIPDNLISPGTVNWFAVNPSINASLRGVPELSACASLGARILFFLPDAPVLFKNEFQASAAYTLGSFKVSESAKFIWAFGPLPYLEKTPLSALLKGPCDYIQGLGDSLFFSSTRADLKIFGINLFNFIPVDFGLFLFFDAGSVCGGGLAPDFSIFSLAYGPGIRVHFDSPVFVNLEVSCGFNPQGLYKINFAVKGE